MSNTLQNMSDSLSETNLSLSDAFLNPLTYDFVSSAVVSQTEERRRNVLKDKYGIETESYQTFKTKNYGSGHARALLVGAVTAGVIFGAGLLVLGTGGAALAFAGIAGLVIGGVAGLWSNNLHKIKAHKAYHSYLEQATLEGHSIMRQHERGITQTYDNSISGKSYVSSFNDERANQQLAGSGYRGV